MLTTRDKFIELAGKIVSNHSVYIWGAQGQGAGESRGMP